MSKLSQQEIAKIVEAAFNKAVAEHTGTYAQDRGKYHLFYRESPSPCEFEDHYGVKEEIVTNLIALQKKKKVNPNA